jgi:hypothetical protein
MDNLRVRGVDEELQRVRRVDAPLPDRLRTLDPRAERCTDLDDGLGCEEFVVTIEILSLRLRHRVTLRGCAAASTSHSRGRGLGCVRDLLDHLGSRRIRGWQSGLWDAEADHRVRGGRGLCGFGKACQGR